MSFLRSRLAKLEEKAGHRSASLKRMFNCVVRKGREDEDWATAFGALGMTPTDEDFVICLVAVSPKKDDPMDDIIPRAELRWDRSGQPQAA